ncbi:unnamed protein product [Rotaria magnacalcarata]|nr:unnamed protein product [Rotaria magnacalcarata]
MANNSMELDLKNDLFHLGIPDELMNHYPIIKMSLTALTNILRNRHLQKNFIPHFTPIEEYRYDFPNDEPQSILSQINQVFTETNLPTIIFQEDSQLGAVNDCSAYGLYNGRKSQADEDIIYVNKQILESSTLSGSLDYLEKYAAIVLFSMLHEIGHWAFFKFACRLNKEKVTPCGILMEESGDAIEHLIFGFRIQHYGATHPKFHIDDIVTKTSSMRQYRIVPNKYLHSLFEAETYTGIINSASLKITNESLMSSPVLDEELMKFQNKRVFDPVDEPKLCPTRTFFQKETEKRVFEPCDKVFRKIKLFSK